MSIKPADGLGKATPRPYSLSQLGLDLCEWDVCRCIDDVPCKYHAAIDASKERVKVLEEAVVAMHEYFEACARQWTANDGRVVTEKGTVIEGSEEVERLCNRAGRLVVEALAPPV